jgi:hypothetical protein
MRLLSVLVLCAATLAGCGGDDDRSPSSTTRVVDEPCPEGTLELAVRDVLPKTPKGMVLLRVRKDQLEQARHGFETGFGDSLRSLRLGVVAPRGRRLGTGVGVLNLTVRADNDTPPQTTATREALTIAGREGVIAVTPGGGPTRASGSVGDCAVVVLNGTDEDAVRRVAAAIRQPQ